MKNMFKVKFTAKNMAYMAMFVALQVVLQFAFSLIPGQPQGGSITLDLLPIILASYLMGTGYGLFVGVAACILQFVLGMATYIYGPWSILLDYVIPVVIVGLSQAFGNIVVKKHTIYTGIIVTMILKFLSHYLSGAWLFAEYAQGNPWIYSFGYNIAYCLPTLIITYIAFILVYPRLKNIFKTV